VGGGHPPPPVERANPKEGVVATHPLGKALREKLFFRRNTEKRILDGKTLREVLTGKSGGQFFREVFKAKSSRQRTLEVH
jgi:hypothetical protein